MVKIIRYDPFRSLWGLPRWMDSFDEGQLQRGLKIHETNESIIAEAVVAGVPTDNVEVNIEDGILTIKAEKKEEIKGEGEYKSSSYQYYYTAALSGGAWDKAQAEVEDGVVKVVIPKEEAKKPRKITVKAKGKK